MNHWKHAKVPPSRAAALYFSTQPLGWRETSWDDVCLYRGGRSAVTLHPVSRDCVFSPGLSNVAAHAAGPLFLHLELRSHTYSLQMQLPLLNL